VGLNELCIFGCVLSPFHRGKLAKFNPNKL
jgi:hypothetical protein